ncbi:MAG: exonuclease, partial [Candidatus Thorarchaeota archaeon]
GHSSTNINSIYKGRRNNMRDNIKRLRKTKHTHHPVDDAKGNAEALLKMMKQGLKINF